MNLFLLAILDHMWVLLSSLLFDVCACLEICVFETGLQLYASRDDLELMIVLPPFPKC